MHRYVASGTKVTELNVPRKAVKNKSKKNKVTRTDLNRNIQNKKGKLKDKITGVSQQEID